MERGINKRVSAWSRVLLCVSVPAALVTPDRKRWGNLRVEQKLLNAPEAICS